MKNIFKNLFKEPEENKPLDNVGSSYYSGDNVPIRTSYPVYNRAFDGEKTYGELGNPVNLIPDYKSLRYRAYEASLSSDIIKMVTGKFLKWTVGLGLNLQAEPNEPMLKAKGITDDLRDFRTLTESRFTIFAESIHSDYQKMNNLHKVANDAFKSSFLGGDCLAILRYDDNDMLTVQAIDGQEVSSPIIGTDWHKQAKSRGNEIIHGIEVDSKGTHVAFYVVKHDSGLSIEHERIQARGEESGKLFAWMIYGDKHRINHMRGIPIVTAIIEKAKKLDRYTEASVSSAEERAKIVYSIEHDNNSTGENPMLEVMKKRFGNKEALNSFDLGENISNNITLSTNKMAFNMPVGSKLQALESNAEDNYDKFYNAILEQVCAAVDIPPEVALQRYDSNYSASRAAINGWGYIINIYRNNFANDFYKKFYSFWLESEILKGNINAPGFINALQENDIMTLEAYKSCKFTGVNMPHIDPLKEVNAVRAMLGDSSKGQQPLISHEQADEILNLGDWRENIKKYNQEESAFIEFPEKETLKETKTN